MNKKNIWNNEICHFKPTCISTILIGLGCFLNCILKFLSYPNNVQVAERAHFLWNNEHIHHLIMCNRQVIMPIVFSSLQRNSKNHWNRTVLNQTQNVMKMFHEVDEVLVLSCQNKFEEDESATTVVAERRQLTWERLEKVAGGGGFQPIVGNVSILETTATATCVVSC